MKKALLIDRDWTLNIDIWYAHKLEDCNFIEDGIWEILKKFRDNWYLLIIITNQAWIDKWFYTEKEFYLFMSEMEKKLEIKFDWIYFCAYHPDYTWRSKCRKPDNGMILDAQIDLSIDLEKSYMIWDHFKDVEAWKKSKCSTILINTQDLDINKSEVKPDYLVNSWKEIEKIILDK